MMYLPILNPLQSYHVIKFIILITTATNFSNYLHNYCPYSNNLHHPIITFIVSSLYLLGVIFWLFFSFFYVIWNTRIADHIPRASIFNFWLTARRLLRKFPSGTRAYNYPYPYIFIMSPRNYITSPVPFIAVQPYFLRFHLISLWKKKSSPGAKRLISTSCWRERLDVNEFLFSN